MEHRSQQGFTIFWYLKLISSLQGRFPARGIGLVCMCLEMCDVYTRYWKIPHVIVDKTQPHLEFSIICKEACWK